KKSSMASSEAVPGTPDGSVNSSILHKEGPVLCFINKRLRALKKKYSRILQIEENKSKGKTINKEQEDVLQSKIGVVALIEEFEKLKQPLSIAVKEELAERERELMRRDEDGSSANEKENIFPNEKENSSANEKENNSANGETIETEEPNRKDVPLNGCSEKTSKVSEEGFITNEQSPDSLAELLKFIYFSQLFHLTSHEDFASMMWTKMHERISCLSYDYVTEDATDHLNEEDLDGLSILGSLLTSRPSNLTLSHKDALLNCLHHAKQWLHNSDQLMHPNIPISYSSLRDKLNRITSSEYFVMTPELKIFNRQNADAATQNVPNVMLHEFPTEDEVLQMEGGPNYFQHQNQTETEQENYQDEESCNAVGNSEGSNSVGDGNTSFQHAGEKNSSSEILQNESNQIHTSPVLELKQDESYNMQLHSLPQLSQLNEQYDEKHLSQQQNSGQQPQQRQWSQQQYYARNGGMLRSNQRQRGGRSMGYAGGGRGNRGGRVSYSDGYGQYYDQGTQPHRNYYTRRGQGGRGVGPRQAIAFQE
ncbi:hypothetical protein KI387_021732, partial [Taxus chinensis]